MQDNLNKASQRGDRLDALQDKTDNLATSAQGFRRGANRVRKQMWWKDMKMRICIIVGIIILLIVIIVPSGKEFPLRALFACARPGLDGEESVTEGRWCTAGYTTWRRGHEADQRVFSTTVIASKN